MKHTLFKSCSRLCTSLFGIFLLVSCAGSDIPLKTDPQYGSAPSKQSSGTSNRGYSKGDPIQSAEFEPEVSATAKMREFKTNGFLFKTPSADWDLVSDPSDETAPLEFFNPQTGRRAEIQTIILSTGESPNVMDRARAEMQGRGLSYRKAEYTAVSPAEEVGMTGAFFETAGSSAEASLAADGFVAASGNHVFFLTLSTVDSVSPRAEFKKEWREFFAGFSLSEELKKTSKEQEISKDVVTDYESSALGYKFHVEDSLWHNWASVAAQNGDPDLVLANMKEETAFFVYGTIIDPNEVSAQDLFKVLLIRLGLDPEDPNLDVVRVRGGNANQFSQNFTCTRVIDGYDFKYSGRYFWDNGRGILVAGWAQGILYKKYAKVLERAMFESARETSALLWI